MLHGAAGIIVSNHGGRQLDGVPAALDALPECVEAAAGRVPVHVDGGIRRGSDVFKALALGAECCWVGRIPLWGLAVCLVFFIFVFFLGGGLTVWEVCGRGGRWVGAEDPGGRV